MTVWREHLPFIILSSFLKLQQGLLTLFLGQIFGHMKWDFICYLSLVVGLGGKIVSLYSHSLCYRSLPKQCWAVKTLFHCVFLLHFAVFSSCLTQSSTLHVLLLPNITCSKQLKKRHASPLKSEGNTCLLLSGGAAVGLGSTWYPTMRCTGGAFIMSWTISISFVF